MKIYTSYFDNVNNLLDLGYKNLISIAGKCPNNFLSTRLNDNRCWEYKKLAPKYNWWKEWHDNQLSNEWYIKKYYETVLNKLNPTEVVKELFKHNSKENAILLCWEKNEFCHRHIVAEWLNKNLNIEIIELE